MEAGASSSVGRFRRSGVGAGQRAGQFRLGQGCGRGHGTGRAFPDGVVPVFEHALGWWRCRTRSRNAWCARVCWRCSRGRAWRPGSWRSTTPPAWATATPTARPHGPACSPCSARTTGSSPGSATPYVFVKLKQSRMACRFSPKQRRVLVQLSEKPAAIASSSIPSGRGFVCTTLPRT